MSNTPSPDSEHKDIHPSSATNKTNKMSVLGSAFSAWPSAGCKGRRPERSQLVWSSPFKFFLNTLKKICTVAAERTQSARATRGRGGRRPWGWTSVSAPSSWPRRQWLSYPPSPSRCTYRLLRCRSSAPMTTPSTVREIKDELNVKNLTWIVRRSKKKKRLRDDRCWTKGSIWLISRQYLFWKCCHAISSHKTSRFLFRWKPFSRSSVSFRYSPKRKKASFFFGRIFFSFDY